SGRAQRRTVLGRQHEMIHPLEKIRAGLVAHPLRKSAREGVSLQKGLEGAAHQSLRFSAERPVEDAVALGPGRFGKRRRGHGGRGTKKGSRRAPAKKRDAQSARLQASRDEKNGKGASGIAGVL